VTESDPAAGYGDLHPATEHAAALAALGHRVELLEIAGGGWRKRAHEIDVLISLHDRLDLGDVPDRVVTAAWVRNWTDRWIGRPWFAAYEAVFASSQASVELIAEESGVEASLLPLATNPERFKPLPAVPDLRADLMFAGNHWGGERAITHVLPRLADSFDVRVYGKGWEGVPGMAPLSRGALPYGELPLAYASSALVLDDSASHTLPFGAVNSRVFDALACGVPVASNDEQGVRALLGEDFPVWRDQATLESLAREAREDSARLKRIARELRAEVLARHTYMHRARQLSASLALA
jgi:glycosyltransferase involved in cell wall biosynthesis